METSTDERAERERRLPSDLEFHLGYWLRRVSNHVSGTFARALQRKQTSVAEWVMLRHLLEQPGTTPGELADALGLTRGAVSKVIDKLEAKKWITRAAKQEDHRVQLLSLTRQGRGILPELARIADQNDQNFFDCMDPNEKATLRHLLCKLAAFHKIRNVPIE